MISDDFKLLKELEEQFADDASKFSREGKEQHAFVALIVRNSILKLMVAKAEVLKATMEIETNAMKGLKDQLDKGEHP